MGTSKGYISPTNPEWRSTKRAVTSFAKNRTRDSLSRAVSRFAKAMQAEWGGQSAKVSSSMSFSSSSGRMIAFISEAKERGLGVALNSVGLSELTDKTADEIIQELLLFFSNDGSTREDSLVLDALSSVFVSLNIESIDGLLGIDIKVFLMELIIQYVCISFDHRFCEKIGQGRSPEETQGILQDTHAYISGTLRERLTITDIQGVVLSDIKASSIVTNMLDEAFSALIQFYGDDLI